MIYGAMRPGTPFIAIATAALIAVIGGVHAEAANCERVSKVKLPNTTIVTAHLLSAGTFAPPYGDPIDKLPAFCRVSGVIKPTSDSYIRFEVWMPGSGWNGKFLGVGNGGFAGSIDYRAMAGNLKRGYATAATDTGHEAEGGDGSWAFKHPEKIIDFGYRALHETTGNAKAIITEFYGQPARQSYFDSCSDGGREAMMEAQRFPEDYDGILAGAPAMYWTQMLGGGASVLRAMYGNPASYISSTKIPAIEAAVLRACDAQDGVKDGVLNEPARCHFDPSVLLCKDVESRTCLTKPQIAALKNIYAGALNSHRVLVLPGFVPGGEMGSNGWPSWITGPAPGFSYGAGFVEGYFRYMVFENPAWSPLTGNLDDALRTADEKTAHALDATDPDLHRFQARGGKLILYHGWNDAAISPLNTIKYYKSLEEKMGAQNTRNFARLYMVSGMQHCGGGPGASSFGQLGSTTAKGPEHGIYTALEQWVEKSAAPGDVIATKYVEGSPAKGVQMTRPICPYPQVPKYKGTGDTNDYTNFVCSAESE